MSSHVTAAEVEGVSLTPSRRGVLLEVLRTNPMALVGTLILLVVIALAVAAPLIAPYGEHEQVGEVFQHPSSKHWLGLDDGGVDMLTLMLYGTRVSLIVGFAAALVAMLIGGTVGVALRLLRRQGPRRC